MAESDELMNLVAEIVCAHAQNNVVSSDQLVKLIQDVHNALSSAGRVAAEQPKAEPAVPVKGSVMASHITCLDCGKQLAMLRRHLMTHHKLTPEQYRLKWRLLSSYPLVAPNYAKTRSALAKRFGLGKKGAATPRKT